MSIAIFLLYRIAYPKQADTKKSDEAQAEKPKTVPEVMGKSRFVLPDRSKPLQTPATSQEIEKGDEKPNIFASKTEESQSAAVSPEQTDDDVSGNSNPEIMSIPLESESEEENETDIDAEETEEIRIALGHEAIPADGIDYDDLKDVVKVVNEQPEKVSEETCRTLMAVEKTDMFEKYVSGDAGKMDWIKAVIERNIQKKMPDTGNQDSDTDCDDFIADFLG